jgi:hypothetical protein
MKSYTRDLLLLGSALGLALALSGQAVAKPMNASSYIVAPNGKALDLTYLTWMGQAQENLETTKAAAKVSAKLYQERKLSQAFLAGYGENYTPNQPKPNVRASKKSTQIVPPETPTELIVRAVDSAKTAQDVGTKLSPLQKDAMDWVQTSFR